MNQRDPGNSQSNKAMDHQNEWSMMLIPKYTPFGLLTHHHIQITFQILVVSLSATDTSSCFVKRWKGRIFHQEDWRMQTMQSTSMRIHLTQLGCQRVQMCTTICLEQTNMKPGQKVFCGVEILQGVVSCNCRLAYNPAKNPSYIV